MFKYAPGMESGLGAAASVVQSLQGFAISHYKPPQTATAPTA